MSPTAIWRKCSHSAKTSSVRVLAAVLFIGAGSSPLLACDDGIAVPDPENNPGLVADCKALLATRDKLAGNNVFLDWDAEAAISSWEGVSISGSPARLSFLRLDNRQLTGTLPPELGQLTGLRALWLQNNQLTGKIPPELGQLSELQGLHLERNQLNGALPEELSQLSQLVDLWLHSNMLTGEVPRWLAELSGLRKLYLSRNQLTGEIPAELSQLTNLWSLGLSDNQLTGKIPPELGQLTQLDTLLLGNNELRGGIPSELSGLTQLQSLSLSHNQLTGAIPTWLGHMLKMQYLSLFGNQLTGPIPPELGQLTELDRLFLNHNQLTGAIPPELGRLSQLRQLTLNNNQLTGEIPSELERLTLLERLFLDDNQLTGPIPPELGQLTRLELLLLNHNQLTGTIPSEIERLTLLSQLRLDHNQLRGKIPPGMGQRNYRLRHLRLDHNQLTGEIPAELGQLGGLRELRLSGNRLTGKIPAELGGLVSLVQLSLDNNQLTGEIPAELGKLPWLWSLHLQHNQLTGEIPAELGQLSRLRQFSFRGNRLTGPVPPELDHLPDVYVLNLAATRTALDRINVTWDDPGDTTVSYEYRLWDEHTLRTEWAAIEDPETMLMKGERLTIEWMLTDIPTDAVSLYIEVRVSNSTGSHTSRAEVKRLVTAGAPDPDSSESLFVPVLLTSAGRNDAFFTSELTLTNRGTEEATLHYTYTARSGGGSGTATDTLAPGRQRIQPDAIDYLTGLGIPIPGSGNRIGTLRVEVSGSSGVSLTTRTSTDVPDGRAGLAYPSIAEEEGFQEAVYLCGLRQNTQDRSNVAFQHMGSSDEGPITLRTTVYSGEADDTRSRIVGEVELQPGGFHQYNEVLKELGRPAQGYVKVEKVEGEAPFYAYGVINDNFNSDGSFVFPLTASSLVGTTGLTLPVIIETGNFQSELTVTNFSASGRQVTFSFVAEAVDTGDDTAEFSLTLKAGEQFILPDIVEKLRRREVAGIGPANRAYVGALFARAAEGDMSGIVIGARTGAPDTRGGQYSLFYNGVPHGSASVESAWIYGLQQNAENRSNLALVNTGEIDDSSSTFEITIYDGSRESQLRTRSVPLGPRRWRQENGILGKISQGYVQVRKTSGNNPFITYGVINDGGAPGERSGDGAYLPAGE